jgi:hypothetical protein
MLRSFLSEGLSLRGVGLREARGRLRGAGVSDGVEYGIVS